MSTPELKDLLDSLEYEQEEDYGNGPQDYEYQTDGLNYYDNYDDLVSVHTCMCSYRRPQGRNQR